MRPSSLRLTGTTPTTAGVGIGVGEGTATIRDDERLTVNLSGPRSVTEDIDATYTVRVTGGTGSAPIVVNYQAGATPGSLTIAARNAIATFAATAGDAPGTLVASITSVSTTAGRVTRGTSSVSTTIRDVRHRGRIAPGRGCVGG